MAISINAQAGQGMKEIAAACKVLVKEKNLIKWLQKVLDRERFVH